MSQNHIGLNLFQNTSFNTSAMLWGTLATVSFVLVCVLGSYLWKRYTARREFEVEVEALGLDRDQGDALIDMVRRHRTNQPLEILYSPRRFDEMVTMEMLRVLDSPASREVKERYIDELYELRDSLNRHEEAYEPSL